MLGIVGLRFPPKLCTGLLTVAFWGGILLAPKISERAKIGFCCGWGCVGSVELPPPSRSSKSNKLGVVEETGTGLGLGTDDGIEEGDEDWTGFTEGTSSMSTSPMFLLKFQIFLWKKKMKFYSAKVLAYSGQIGIVSRMAFLLSSHSFSISLRYSQALCWTSRELEVVWLSINIVIRLACCGNLE